jgi:hypothetical protein
VWARRLAGPAAAAELPQGEPVARDATVVPQQAAGAAAWDAAAEPQQEAAARVGAAVPQQAAAVRQREARGAAAGALLQGAAAPDVRVVQRRAALPSAAPWVFRRGQPPPWPAPQPAGQLARAMERSRIATP